MPIHNTDLETFHKRIEKHINLAGIVAENKLLPSIIRMCRLKPVSIFTNTKFNFKTHLVKNWVDEFGYQLIINGNQINVVKNPIHNELVSTDLFFGRSVGKIVSASTMILVGELDNAYTIICFGRDEYLRGFVITDTVKRIASLSVGFDVLCVLAKNTHIGTIKEFGKEYSNLFNRMIAFPWPAKQDILSYLPKHIIKEINE